MKNKNTIIWIYLAAFAALMSLGACSSSIRYNSDRSVKYRHAKKRTVKKPIVSKQPKVILAKIEDVNRKEIIAEAATWIGTPYKWGGESKEGADCSGFVQSTYKAFGINLPRTAAGMYDNIEHIDPNDVKVGDLMFFKGRSRVSHVGIYIGDNQMIHASSKHGVIIQNLDKYNYFKEKRHFAGFGRILGN